MNVRVADTPPKESVRILLNEIIDYAGLFPPSQVSMSEAVLNYATYRNSNFGWMLGRFILPVARLEEFYESAKFPSLDFSLVYVLDDEGRTVDMLVDKRGNKAKPARTIPASFKRSLEMPEHLEVRAGGIDDVEAALKS